MDRNSPKAVALLLAVTIALGSFSPAGAQVAEPAAPPAVEPDPPSVHPAVGPRNRVLDELAAVDAELDVAVNRAADLLPERDRLRTVLAAAEWSGQVDVEYSGGTFHYPFAVFPLETVDEFIDSWGFARSGGRRHKGTDLLAPRGVEVYAIEDGVIDRFSNSALGGKAVYFQGDSGAYYFYAHLDDFGTQVEGQRVRAGDVIGYNGDTGNARGTPHLHLQWSPTGGENWVNPYPMLAAIWMRERVPAGANLVGAPTTSRYCRRPTRRSAMYPGVHARQRPDHPAIVMAGSGEVVTYRELDERSNRLARLWHARGLRRGDHVAIVMENHVEFYDVGVGRAALGPVLHAGQLPPHRPRDRLHRRRLRCPFADHVAHRFAGAGRRARVEIALMVRRHRRRVGALRGAGRRPAGRPPRRPARPGAAMFYSSGTTGRPKGILFPLPDRRIDDRDPMISRRATSAGIRPPTPSTCRRRRSTTPPPWSPTPWSTATAARWSSSSSSTRGLPRRHRAVPDHPRPVRPDHVRAHAEAARRGPRAPRPVDAAPRSPTPPRRARSR